MIKTRLVIFVLILAFCFSAIVVYSAKKDAWLIIEDKWLNSECGKGITNDVVDPINILKSKLRVCKDHDIIKKIHYLLGECYFHGKNYFHAQNYQLAAEYYQKSANEGYVYAKYKLAWMVLNNKAFLITKEKAEGYMKEAAKSGHSSAIKYLNNKEKEKKEKEEKEEKEKKEKEEKELLLKGKIQTLISSSEKEDKNAIFEIANNYSKIEKFLSEEDKKRIDNIIDNIKKSAENDKKEAMFQLAVLYNIDNFNLFTTDKAKAKYWIKKYQHELDSVFDKEMAMLEFYFYSGNAELVILQWKKIIKNIRQFDISEITPKKIDCLLDFIWIPYHNFLYALNDNSYSNIEEDNEIRKFLSVISMDSIFKNYYDYITPILDKTNNKSIKYNEKDFSSYFSLAEEKKDIWLSAVNKFYKTHKEGEEVIKTLSDYFDEIGQKIGSELDLEDYQAIKKVMEKVENDKKVKDKKIQYYLFDVPIIIACSMTNSKLREYFIANDYKLKIAKTFSLITSSALPYTVNNKTREDWAESCKKIKQNFSENEYKELQNISTKLIPALDLPQNFDMK